MDILDIAVRLGLDHNLSAMPRAALGVAVQRKAGALCAIESGQAC